MFELEKSSLFFEDMASEHPTVVQNIEIVHENKSLLDIYYHNPKRFILHLNNLLRALIFFIERSIKNSPDWLNLCVKNYRENNRQEYEILKRLRNMSAHQALIFPKESIVTGLYRIRSSYEYILKIGMGDFAKPGEYSWDLAMKNTDEIFHDLLVLHSMVFMDLEHSALNECLGLTRKWFFNVKFKNKTTEFNETVDVYSLLCGFSSKLLDVVCQSYAEYKGLKFDSPFHYEMKDFNCVNTLLELDLYPSLFSEWWESEIEPLNYGIRVHKNRGDSVKNYDQLHHHFYQNLCNTPESYKELLIKYSDMPEGEALNEKNANEFFSFVYLNHWHFKNSFKTSLLDSPIQPNEIMQLQRLGKIYIEECRKKKLCTMDSTCKNFKEHLDILSSKI